MDFAAFTRDTSLLLTHSRSGGRHDTATALAVAEAVAGAAWRQCCLGRALKAAGYDERVSFEFSRLVLFIGELDVRIGGFPGHFRAS